MKILEARKEIIVFHGNIAPHKDEFLPETVIISERIFGLFARRGEESAGIDYNIVRFWILRIFYVLDRSPIRVLQNRSDSEFEIDEVFGTTEVDGGETKGYYRKLRIKNLKLRIIS